MRNMLALAFSCASCQKRQVFRAEIGGALGNSDHFFVFKLGIS